MAKSKKETVLDAEESVKIEEQSGSIGVNVVLLEGGTLPVKKSESASAFDLYARLEKPLKVNPGSVVVIPTGVKLSMPAGIGANIKPRSGFSAKNLNVALGTIDNDYVGELGVILANNSAGRVEINPNERIAQLEFYQVLPISLHIAEETKQTNRGEKGFGSTGK